jgi:hypothetical protein
MATIRLPPDFKEFLQLLNAHGVEYLLVGGYAVGYYGYPRPTGDMDVWVAKQQQNADNLVNVLQAFGFSTPDLSPALFLADNQIVRLGFPPLRIEILTNLSGVDFADCYAQRAQVVIDDVPINLINLAQLKINKRASGRHKDLNDLENLP